MKIDVTSEIEIERPRAVVAAFSADPDNVPRWYVNIKSVEWKTPRPATVGSRIAFVAQFLGRRLAYTYEIAELAPGERLVMRTAEGPFPMETSYSWRDAGEGRTRMALRNCGAPGGFSRLMSPFMAFAVRRSTDRDLLLLKTILEATD
ncbi:SRPBCC family protein [Mesorhizobium sp.]|uniref:SRPBCC family protein n=1 Tax=Mesorhizobium sp. TaxID=1871066 RepID=UPI0025FA328C|nr:SRPBCC family protein [Mesorhizobium sp.]